MTDKKMFIVSTHNYYEAEIIDDIFETVLKHSYYRIFRKRRVYPDKYGDGYGVDYYSYRAKVTKEEELALRHELNSMKYPNYFLKKYGGEENEKNYVC